MIVNILLILAGIALVLWGADLLTKGASGLAKRWGMPEIVIGLTVVAMGTSMPEFFVSFVSALKGTPDMAVGNVIGSNIFNTLLIVGCAAAIAPMSILPQTIRKDIPWTLFASVLLVAFCLGGGISRWGAAALTGAFLMFMWFTLRGTQTDTPAEETDLKAEELTAKKPVPMWRHWLFVALGLAFLIAGSNAFVSSATAIASAIGISEAVIGLTIVAGGTSLPELATSIVAARKGNSGIAIGNVLGSNVFNILMILGITGLIAPMQISGITHIDLAMLIVSTLLLWLFAWSKLRISRWEGLTLIAVFIAYIGWLIWNI